MIMRQAALLLLISLSLASCSDNLYKEKVVGSIAQQYYTYLIEGDYEAFMDVSDGANELRQSERSERIDNLKMFIAHEEKARGGIKSAEVQQVEVSKSDDTAEVFLCLTYGNGAQEVVVVPLILKDKVWYLR